MKKHKKSFFDRLTGGSDDFDVDQDIEDEKNGGALEVADSEKGKKLEWMDGEEDGQLTVDMYQTPHEVIIQTMVAGVKPEELEIAIARDMITLKGKRQRVREVEEDNYYYKELYWGSFSRSILLPQEIDPDEVDASTKNGLLTIRLPKIDKDKVKKVKIKNE